MVKKYINKEDKYDQFAQSVPQRQKNIEARTLQNMESAFGVDVSIIKDGGDDPDAFEDLAPLPKMKSSSPDIKRDKYYRNEIYSPNVRQNGSKNREVKFGSDMGFGSMLDNFNTGSLGLNKSKF